MLKLHNVNKYFNRNQSNQIHVINGTSLEFEEAGLVALLGPSGCGKTTLLNVIGGLDKVDSGDIYVNGERITGRTVYTVDRIRNLNIGYVFQNYNLIDDMTVFDNVAMVLRMVGIKDKDEIKAKVEYALELVGMYRYRKRYADMLSGGERQRVGIARAIVKNPSIIIADEPTGNLDSANTIEVMNIIKAISRDKLVILVTHEEELAEFYADRIIRLRDGSVISDEINQNAKDLDYRLENKIYLKDIEDQRVVHDDDYNIRLYNDSGSGLDLDIVISRGNIFIKTHDSANRLEIVDENSSIELVDDHYRAMTAEEAEANKFHPERLKSTQPLRHSSILNLGSMITSGFRTVSNYHILKKILLIGFLLSAMFITYAVSNIAGIINMPDDKFVKDNISYVGIVGQKLSVDDYLTYESDPTVEYALPGNGQINMYFRYDEYWQTSPGGLTFTGSLSADDELKESDLIVGRRPSGSYEVVVDALILRRLQEESGDIIMAGYKTPEELVGRHLKLKGLPDFTIVGVTDKHSPCIYASKSMMLDMLACNQPEGAYADDDEDYGSSYDEDSDSDDEDSGSSKAVLPSAAELMDYSLFLDQIRLVKGDLPEGDYEVLIDNSFSKDIKIGKEIKPKVNGHKLKVVGFYTADTFKDKFFVSKGTIKYRLINEATGMTIKPAKSKEETMAALSEYGLKVRDLYSYQRSQYRKSQLNMVKAFLIVGAIIIVISLVEVFLMMRASFMSRIKEVGTLRAIGVKKSDIYKMFTGEIIAITVIASLPGWLLMNYIVYKLQGLAATANMFTCTPQTVIISLVLIFAFNLVFGLLPVMGTLIKRPAQILARTDVN